ncbi:ABC-2 family transporter protein-domain-containing protein, partial [Chytriomyces sp. MP71]
MVSSTTTAAPSPFMSATDPTPPPPPTVVQMSATNQASTTTTTTAPLNRKPNQLKALSRKTISFQKRQMFTNICCICLCPLMMVAISAALGKVINDLIAKSQTIEDILYCSNNNSLNAIGWPIYNASDSRIYGADVPNGKSVNFLNYISFAKLANPGAAALGAKKPCVLWFGPEYPQFSPIYERNANLTGIAQLDSTYIPPPDGGWIAQLTKLATNPSSFDFDSFQRFTGFQQAAWLVAGSDPSLVSAAGALPDTGSIPLSQLPTFNTTQLTDPHYNPTRGLFGAIPQRIYVNISTTPASPQPFTVSGAQLYPYLDTPAPPLTTLDAIDDALSTHLQQLIASLATLNKTILTVSADKRSIADLTRFSLDAARITTRMPAGGLFLTLLDPARARLAATLSIGTDIRVSAAANYPTQGQRQLMAAAQVGQAAARVLGAATGVPAAGAGAGVSVTQGVRAFPYVKSTALTLPFGGLIGRILYPFGVSFLLPIFVIMLVKEKEDRIYIMMKMNGVKAWAYYLSHYVTFFLLFVFSTVVFFIVGRGSKLDMFTKTSPAVLIVLFFLWGNVQIALAFVISTLFSKSRIALVMTFLVVLVGVVISLVLDNLFEDTWQPAAINVWPPFAFYRGLSLMNVASYTDGAKPFGTEQFSSGTEFRQISTFLFLEIFVFGALAA